MVVLFSGARLVLSCWKELLGGSWGNSRESCCEPVSDNQCQEIPRHVAAFCIFMYRGVNVTDDSFARLVQAEGVYSLFLSDEKLDGPLAHR